MQRTYEAPLYVDQRSGIRYVKASELTQNDLKKIQSKIAQTEVEKQLKKLAIH